MNNSIQSKLTYVDYITSDLDLKKKYITILEEKILKQNWKNSVQSKLIDYIISNFNLEKKIIQW